eukprot:4918531-Pleurochrysis_carterae.AAC.2
MQKPANAPFSNPPPIVCESPRVESPPQNPSSPPKHPAACSSPRPDPRWPSNRSAVPSQPRSPSRWAPPIVDPFGHSGVSASKHSEYPQLHTLCSSRCSNSSADGFGASQTPDADAPRSSPPLHAEPAGARSEQAPHARGADARPLPCARALARICPVSCVPL